MSVRPAYFRTALKTGAVAASVLLLASCAEPYGPNQAAGGLLGAGAGALIGNQFGHGSGRVAATAGGAILGGALGSSIGRDADRARYGYYGAPAYAPPPPAYYAPPPPPAYYAPAPTYYYPAPAYYYPSGPSMHFSYHGHR